MNNHREKLMETNARNKEGVREVGTGLLRLEALDPGPLRDSPRKETREP